MGQTEVEVAQGRLAGIEEDGVHRFLGVPYAAPPVGALRWAPPSPPLTWEGVRPARAFGAVAVQTVGGGPESADARQSEDCLHLNVWTATLDADARGPVMVWIHGGGNLGGSSLEAWYDGSSLAREGVVVVTFNYRLGAFGFLADPSIGANFAVLDYVAVLNWVAQNIAAFGGDPGNVTIFGQSAGAVAVRTLLSCPKAHGLFHRAIIQSAGFEQFSFAPGWSYGRAQAAADALFERLGTRDLAELRALPTAKIKQASHELCGIFPKPGQVHTPANLVWMPVPDGEIVIDDGSFPGWAENVPLMLGCLENEARYFIKPGGLYSWELVAGMAQALCGPRADEVIALLRDLTDDPYEALDKLYTDVIWIEPALATAKRFAALGRRCFYYHFARVSPGAAASNELVKHSAEIAYVFGNLPADGCNDTDQEVSAIMQQAWMSFARDGVPRGGAFSWPEYREPDPQMAWIGDTDEIRAFEVTSLTRIIHSLRQPAQEPIDA